MSKHSEVPMADRELMQYALDALEANQPVNYCMNNNGEKFPMMQEDPFRVERNSKAMTALRERLAQPEPDFSKAGFGKPQNEEGCAGCGKHASDGWALYCVKCSEREWVGLTDEEILDVLHPLVMADMSDEATDYEIARAIEAKLKEKNHG